MVQDMLAYKGMIVTHKTIRLWAEKFGRDYANKIRRRTPRLGDKWHLDEAVITINGKKHWLWRAVDQDGSCWRSLCKAVEMPKQPNV
jgi:putative transposase